MGQYITLVIYRPNDDDPGATRVINNAIKQLTLHTTAMAFEDTMTILDHIENDEGCPPWVVENARESTARLLEKQDPRTFGQALASGKVS